MYLSSRLFGKIHRTLNNKRLLLVPGWERGARHISCLPASCLTEQQMASQWPETGASFLYEPCVVETDREMSPQASNTDRTWLKSSDSTD